MSANSVDELEGVTDMSGGLWRATVVDDQDPSDSGRVLVVVAGSEDEAAWASSCFPLVAAERMLPETDSSVWVLFEEDDPRRPVVVGLCVD